MLQVKAHLLCSFVSVLDLGCCAGSSLVAAGGAAAWLGCSVFLLWLLSLRSVGSRAHGLQDCGPRGLGQKLSSCGAGASLFRGMQDLPGPGMASAACHLQHNTWQWGVQQIACRGSKVSPFMETASVGLRVRKGIPREDALCSQGSVE